MTRLYHFIGRVLIYGALVIWSIICILPIYWTLTTSFKSARDVLRGKMIPWVDYTPNWVGWRSLGLSPDTIFETSTIRVEFLHRLLGSVVVSVGAAALALVLGSLAAYGLARFRYRFGFMGNKDISFFFLSQLILPPVVIALPILLMYRAVNLLDSWTGLIILYTLSVLPIVIWIMRDQFASIPHELEQAALVDGCSTWRAFLTIVLPIALPGMAAAFILSVIICWNEYFLSALLTSRDGATLPVMVASQTSQSGVGWWTMAALCFASILPLMLVGVFMERFIVKGLTAGSVK
jgi:multiple sugar transport system permease protein